MPSTILKYPLYPRFLVPTPISKYSRSVRPAIALPMSCPPQFQIQLKSKLSVSILSCVMRLTSRWMGLTALRLRWLKQASNLNMLSWLKFFNDLAMQRVPFYYILLLRTNNYTDLSRQGFSFDVKIVKFWNASGPSLLAVKSIDNSCNSSLKGCINNELAPLSPIFNSINPNFNDLNSNLANCQPKNSPISYPVVTALRLRCRCLTACALMELNSLMSCYVVNLQLSKLICNSYTDMVVLKKWLTMYYGSWQQANDRVKLLISLLSKTDRYPSTYSYNYFVLGSQSATNTALEPSTSNLTFCPLAITNIHVSSTTIAAIQL